MGEPSSNRLVSSSDRCKNLYRFIRLRLGEAISDREIARRWSMEWKSFSALKHGKRQVPRVTELVELARILELDSAVVFEIASGAPAEEVHSIVSERNSAKLATLLLKDMGNDSGVDAAEAMNPFRLQVERVNEPMFVLDVQMRIKEVNVLFLQTMGYLREQVIDRSFFELLPPDETSRFMEILASIYRDGAIDNALLRLFDEHRSARHVELQAVRIDDARGNPLGLQCQARDVTGLRAEKEQLETRYAGLNTMVDALPAACFLVDENANVVLKNRIAESIFDSHSFEKNVRALYERALSTGTTVQDLARVTSRTGDAQYFLQIAAPISGLAPITEDPRVVELWIDLTEELRRGDPAVFALLEARFDQAQLHSGHLLEKRRFIRVPFQERIEGIFEGKTISILGGNISGGGMLIRVRDPIPVGAKLTLGWKFPHLSRSIRAHGHVVWRSERYRDEYLAGVEFTEIDDSDRREIAQFVIDTLPKKG